MTMPQGKRLPDLGGLQGTSVPLCEARMVAKTYPAVFSRGLAPGPPAGKVSSHNSFRVRPSRVEYPRAKR